MEVDISRNVTLPSTRRFIVDRKETNGRIVPPGMRETRGELDVASV